MLFMMSWREGSKQWQCRGSKPLRHSHANSRLNDTKIQPIFYFQVGGDKALRTMRFYKESKQCIRWKKNPFINPLVGIWDSHFLPCMVIHSLVRTSGWTHWGRAPAPSGRTAWRGGRANKGESAATWSQDPSSHGLIFEEGIACFYPILNERKERGISLALPWLCPTS